MKGSLVLKTFTGGGGLKSCARIHLLAGVSLPSHTATVVADNCCCSSNTASRNSIDNCRKLRVWM